MTSADTIINISTENDVLYSRYKIHDEGRKTPHKYTIIFNRSDLNNILKNGSPKELSDFYEKLDKEVNNYHTKRD